MSPLLLSTALLIEPLILLDRNDLRVFSWSSELDKIVLSSLFTAAHNPRLPSCSKSFILKTPEAWSDVDCFLANVSTRGKKFNLISSFVK